MWELTLFMLKTRRFLPHWGLDEGLKGTIVNRVWPSLHVGLLEIKTTIPLKRNLNILFFVSRQIIDQLSPRIFWQAKQSLFVKKIHEFEMKTFELDTLNIDRWISTVDTFDFWLISSFWISLPDESSLMKFQISRILIGCSGFYIRHSDWLNVTDFSYYKLKIKLILRLIKRGDQSLISISTILKILALKNLPHFSEQMKIFLDSVYNLLNVKSFILSHPTSI